MGYWSTGLSPSLLPYIWVDAIDATLAQVTAHGGEIIEGSHPDEPGGTSRRSMIQRET
jgi:predicted enzyme related to lactoylglutathione lyase